MSAKFVAVIVGRFACVEKTVDPFVLISTIMLAPVGAVPTLAITLVIVNAVGAYHLAVPFAIDRVPA